LGTSKGIGIGVGITVGVFAVAFLIFEMGSSSVDVIEEIQDIVVESDDARLADINSSYDADVDRLRVTIFLTDSNGDYTKVNGNAELTIFNENRREVYSATYNFVKNDFISWQSIFGGGKITGYIIDIRQFFPSSGGEVSGMMGYEVYVDLNTKTKHWELYDEFWSFE